MNQPPNGSTPIDLPRSVRILPNRVTLRLGCATGVAFFAIFMLRGSPASNPHWPISMTSYWFAVAFFGVTALWCGFRILVQLPIIEASELGIAIWFHGPYRRPFFAPWNRVHAVVLTQVRSAHPAIGPARRNALGIELVQDDQFRLPPSAAGADTPVSGAAKADLAWSGRTISGDPRQWVALLQRMKSVYTETVGEAHPV
jgi:hypothetical protein